MRNIVIVFIAFIFTLTLFYYNNAPIFSNVYSDYTVVRRFNSSQGLFVRGKESEYSFNKKGESYVFDGDTFNTQAFFEDCGAKIVKREILSETEIIYAFTNEIKLFRLLYGEKVNVHIAISNGKVKVGIPFIYDSF